MVSVVDVVPGREASGENGFPFPLTALPLTSPPTSGPVRPEDFDPAWPQDFDPGLGDIDRLLRLELLRRRRAAAAADAVRNRRRGAAHLVRLRAALRHRRRATATATSASRLAATLVVAPGAPSLA